MDPERGLLLILRIELELLSPEPSGAADRRSDLLALLRLNFQYE